MQLSTPISCAALLLAAAAPAQLASAARTLLDAADYRQFKTVGWDIPGSPSLDTLSVLGSFEQRLASCAAACDAAGACDKFVLRSDSCTLKGADAAIADAEYAGSSTLLFVPASTLPPAPTVMPVLLDFVSPLLESTAAAAAQTVEDSIIAQEAAAAQDESDAVSNESDSDGDVMIEESGSRIMSRGAEETSDFDQFTEGNGWDILAGDIADVAADGSGQTAQAESCMRACDATRGCDKFVLRDGVCYLKDDGAEFSDAKFFGDDRKLYYRDTGAPKPIVPDVPAAKAPGKAAPAPRPAPAPKPAPAPEPAPQPKASSSSSRASVTPDDFVHQPASLKGSLIKIDGIRVFRNWDNNSRDVDRCAQRCIDEYGDECIYVQTDYPNGRSRDGRCTIARACSGSGCKTVASVNVRSYDKNRANCKHPMYLKAYRTYKSSLPRGADECTNITDDNKIARW